MRDQHADIHGAIQTLLDLPEGERLDWLLQQYPDDSAVRERLLAAIGGSAHDQAAVPDVPFVFAAPTDSAPTRIGRYEILRSLGSGGMGTVLLAHDPQLRRDVALKCLRVKFGSDQARQRFRREARAAAQLRHPNIVTIFDIHDDGPQPVIAMEYIPGQTVAELIEEQRALTLERKLEILEALCAGLDCAHKSGVLHRDIKPANVIVDTGGHVKILDFGVAKMVDSPVVSTELTSEQMVIGTPGYIAPEHLTGGDVTFKSDLFATAVLAYEFLTYRKPFGETRAEIAERILLGTVPPMVVNGMRLPSSIERAVRKGLALKPSDRQDDAAAMRQAFANARVGILREEGRASDESNGGQSELLTWASGETKREKRLKLQPLHVAAGLAVLLLVALVAFWPRSGSSDRPREAVLGADPTKLSTAGATSSSLRTLSITSEPAGASVFLDGRNTGFVTNADVRLDAAKLERIRLVRAGFEPFDVTPTQQDLEKGALHARLRAIEIPWIRVHASGSYPFGVYDAARSISGVAKVHDLSVIASTVLRLRAPEYLLDHQVRVVDGSRGRTMSVTAPELGTLIVRVRPVLETCRVLANSQDLGFPTVSRAVAVGTYTLSLVCPDGQTPRVEQRVSVVAGNETLVKDFGRVP